MLVSKNTIVLVLFVIQYYIISLLTIMTLGHFRTLIYLSIVHSKKLINQHHRAPRNKISQLLDIVSISTTIWSTRYMNISEASLNGEFHKIKSNDISTKMPT